MSEELRPCAFCGHDEARVIVVDEVTDAGCEDATVPLYAASCPYCGASGQMALSEGEAVEAWNRRAERTCHMVHDHLTDTVFCDVCGERFDSVAQYMAMVPKGLSVTEYKPEYKDARYCPHCGAKVVDKQ